MKYDYHRLINNAFEAQGRSATEWGKTYWKGVIVALTKKLHESETVH